MRIQMMGLAAAVAVAVSAAPAAAGCGGCGYANYGYSNYNYAGYAGGCGALVSNCGASYGYSYLPQQAVVYSVQPQYYYVNQGPTYTGPGQFAPVASYQQRAVSGWNGYGYGNYSYNGGPYANASHHYYNGAPAWRGPAVYSYRRAYRPSVRYGYSQRAYRTPRVIYAPRYAAPRYSVAPHQHRYHSHQRVLRRHN